MDIFCERFKELKTKHKYTYQQIADAMNLKIRTVKYYASGEIKPDYYGLVSLANLFDTSIDFLVGRTDNPEINK